jgi:hypothetical protein
MTGVSVWRMGGRGEGEDDSYVSVEDGGWRGGGG